MAASLRGRRADLLTQNSPAALAKRGYGAIRTIASTHLNRIKLIRLDPRQENSSCGFEDPALKSRRVPVESGLDGACAIEAFYDPSVALIDVSD